MKKSIYIIPSIEVYFVEEIPLLANTLETGDDEERAPQGANANIFDEDDSDVSWGGDGTFPWNRVGQSDFSE